MKMPNRDRYILDEIQEINAEIEDIQEYIDFAASETWHYELALIDIDILKQKRERYQELLD